MSVSSIYLGMAIQSFVIAVLMKVNLIEVSPGQQAKAGAIFLALMLLAPAVGK